MRPLTIGQLARRAGVGIETVRFYERRGLLAEPARKGSGYRQYPEDVVDRLLFIRRAQGLGFSLREIADLLALRGDPAAACAEVKERAEARVAQIEDQIRDLQRMRDALFGLTGACPGHSAVSDCPILGALDTQGEPR
jgi:Hg(II)-responsive transcriptional regulator